MNLVYKDLLAPIAPESPSGESLYYTPIFDQIREARREDDELPQGIWEKETKKADWKGIEKTCCAILAEKSKDLHIALWLVEARIAQYGWKVFPESFNFLGELCRAYWETLHPSFTPVEGNEHRMSLLRTFAEKISNRLSLLPIVDPRELAAQFSQVRIPTLASWKLIRHQVQKGTQDGDSPRDLTKSLAQVPHEALIQRKELFQEAQLALHSFENLIDTLSAHATPSFKNLYLALEESLYLLEEALRQHRPSSSQEAKPFPEVPSLAQEEPLSRSVELATQEDPALERTPARALNASLWTKETALHHLEEMAEFFEVHSPQSPLPILLRCAISVSCQPFERLLREDGKDIPPLMHIARLWASLKNL